LDRDEYYPRGKVLETGYDVPGDTVTLV